MRAIHWTRMALIAAGMLMLPACGGGDPPALDGGTDGDSDSDSDSDTDSDSDSDTDSDGHSVPTPFEEGSLIIPMDLDYQDDGMFLAYGLVYQMLKNDINVYWLIKTPKELNEADFVTTAVDVATEEIIEEHGYRGGPFAIAAEDANDALEVVDAWQAEHVTTVHMATEGFIGPVSRTMRNTPRIGIMANGREDISFDYMNAAGIPDSMDQPWPADKDDTGEYPGYPDILSVDEIRGPTIESDTDGALFDEEGEPVFCELMTMHWDVEDSDDEAVAEIREYLHFPVHFFAECQSVNAVENNINGHFLTPNGYIMDEKPDEVDVVHPYLPFSQFDGEFQTVGGSEPSYSLPEGDDYFDDGVVMMTEAGSPIGTRDVWMTGYLDGECDIDAELEKGPAEEDCPGKISYLGGHKYKIDTPISENPDAQGTRFFLNALFEADCVTHEL